MKTQPEPLRCAECGRDANEQACGLVALLGCDYPGDQPDVDTFCPESFERELVEGIRRPDDR